MSGLETTQRWATMLLAILGVAALIALSLSGHAYFVGMKSLRGYTVSLETVNLREGAVEVIVRLDNDTVENMRITSVEYSLYLDGQFVVSNQDRHEEYVVSGGDSILLEESLTPGRWQIKELEEKLQAGEDNSWEVRGRYRVIIPGSDRRMYVSWEDSSS